MTFYRTPQRQSFDANIFEESMVDYGEQVAAQEDLGAIGGMLGYGNIYHYPNFDDLPGGTYMTGSAEQVVGISGNRSSFPGVGVSAEQNSNDYWGLRILDAGVWKVTVNFRCTPASGDTWFQVSTTHDPKYASADTANRRTIAYGNFSDVIVSNAGGELVVPIAMGSGSWTKGEMKMTMYRIDGGTSSFSQNNLRK
ncbi:hypothetical protein [Corynebacterium glyciniphilum]|uniref:hypothetical protein n=1 Tax=Corynebacterium glyciniphilum TaxID=1404244 RepID=UPI0026563187|nr:hypothetical protein [Corynebacterium glyciniphilum]MDN6707042.1 hypothetical protein [Corynebacterium glyciniphilum]